MTFSVCERLCIVNYGLEMYTYHMHLLRFCPDKGSVEHIFFCAHHLDFGLLIDATSAKFRFYLVAVLMQLIHISPVTTKSLDICSQHSVWVVHEANAPFR